MTRLIRIAVYLVGAILWGLCPRFALADDYEFYHENVIGTSLELRVRADDEKAARWAEDRVLREIDRLSAIFSGYDPASEFSRWASAPGIPTKVSPELFEVLQASDSWHSRSGGAFDPRVEALSRLWSGCAREGRLPTAQESAVARALMDRPAWRLEPRDPHGRASDRLSAQPQRDRQGIHRRAGLRPRDGPGSRGPRVDAQRRRRPPRPGRDGRHDRHRRPVGRFGVIRAAHLHRGQGSIGGHQRELPARIPDQRPLVLAHLRSTVGPAGRSDRRRDGHRRAVGRRGRLREGLQHPRAGGERADGTVDAGRRVPDRREGRADGAERRLAPIRAASARSARLGRRPEALRPRRARHRRIPRSPDGSPDAQPRPRGTRTTSWSSTSRSITPRPRRADIDARTWPSGSRTRTAIRYGP